jgi:tetratricopeptide (TPR) repeat protein
VAECRRAIELNPNFSNGYAELGRCLAVLGESREAMEASRTALRLNPRDPTNWERHATLAIVHFTEENYEASLVEARRVTETVPDLPEGQIMLIAAAAACGEIAEARHAAASCLERWPDLRCGNITPIYFIGFLHERPRDRLMAMLRQAGFPA